MSNRSPRDGREEVAAARPDAHAVQAGVERGGHQRAARDVDDRDLARRRPWRPTRAIAPLPVPSSSTSAPRRAACSADDVGQHPRVAARMEDAWQGGDDVHARRVSLAGPRLKHDARAHHRPLRCAASALGSLRAVFDAARAQMVGLEEELMLLRPDARWTSRPARGEALAALRRRHALQARAARRPDRERDRPAAHGRHARRRTCAAAAATCSPRSTGVALVAAAGAHPFAAALGVLNDGGALRPSSRRSTPASRAASSSSACTST